MMATRKKGKGRPLAKVGAEPSRAPEYRAYLPVTVSDGIVQATHHTFDPSLPRTADDQAALEKYWDTGTPRHRIVTLQEKLAALEPITDPYIQEHVNAIRAIHARMKRFTETVPRFSVEQWMALPEEDRVKHAERARAMREVTEEDDLDLERADYLWGKIVAIPLVKKGRRVHKKPGDVGAVTRYLYEQRRPGETALALWERLAAFRSYDEQPVYFDNGEMIDAKTGKSGSFKAFQKRLSPRKSR